MTTHDTDPELGRKLMTLRGFQWVYGAEGDPYSLLLRAESDDPHELGRQVRERDTLLWSSPGTWVTASHACGTVLLAEPRLDPRPPCTGIPEDDTVADAHTPGAAEDPLPWDVPPLERVLPLDGAHLVMSGQENRRLADLVVSALGEGPGEGLTEELTRIHRRSAEGLGGGFDMAVDHVRPVVSEATRSLLGLPAHTSGRFTRLSAGAATAQDVLLCPPRLRTARELIASIADLRVLAAEIVEREDRGEGLVGALLRSGADRARARADAAAVIVLLATAGVETTTNLVCSALCSLWDHPEQWDRLRDAPALAASAIEETLRYAPPVRLHRLYAHEECVVDGHGVEADTQVVVMVEAVNRDPAVFPDPDRFDITRNSSAEHLSLPRGSYAQILAPVVRQQATALLAGVVNGIPGVRRAGPALRRLRSPVSGGVLRLPVTTT